MRGSPSPGRATLSQMLAAAGGRIWGVLMGRCWAPFRSRTEALAAERDC
jgi:hypothetical protein